MNTDQLNSLVRTALKILGTALISTHIPQAVSLDAALNTPDVIGLATLLAGILWSHFSHTGTPPTTPTAATGGSLAAKLPLFLALACFPLVIAGCVPLQPGADPIVVNVERAETLGQSTFDLVLHVDNTDRDFWITNAPAFHDFCEWLRQPQTIEGTNTLPRASAMLLSLDDVKNGYEASTTSSNALQEALATFQAVVSQAQAWSTIVTQPKALP